MHSINVRLTLREEILGSKPASKDIYDNYIASHAPDGDKRKEELDSAENREERGTTVLPRDEHGRPFIYDYEVKGFFKDACAALRGADNTKSNGVTAYKSKIDGGVFIEQRKIPLIYDAKDAQGKPAIGVCERPLRAETAKGPRVTLCRSETAPAGATLEFTITFTNANFLPLVKEWLDYGRFRGLGQWRNSGKGRFTWEELGTTLNNVEISGGTLYSKKKEKPGKEKPEGDEAGD